jgi:hypothetical protein
MVVCDECGKEIDVGDNECYCTYCGVICEGCLKKCDHNEEHIMKIKSTEKKMHNYGFINFSGTPENPLDDEGSVNKPIITKKEFRKLKEGKALDLGQGKCDVLDKRFPGIFEIEYPVSDAIHGEEKQDKKQPNITIE